MGSLLPPAGRRKADTRVEGLDVGDRIRVELIGTDVERGFIDLARAGRGQGELRFACPSGEIDHYISRNFTAIQIKWNFPGGNVDFIQLLG